jgi:hypothetical protein
VEDTVKRILAVLSLVLFTAASSDAADWYVKAGAPHPGDGSKNRPFTSLDQVEAASASGDTIYVMQSQGALDGGIQLKDGQKLIGLGPKVNTANGNSARATLTNTTGARYDGDAVRLAKHNVVENLQIDNTFRSAILGINAVGAQLRNNLMTNIMAVHDIFAIEGPAPSACSVAGACAGEWPNGYILYASQTNHFGAITLVTCGPGVRSAVTLANNPDIRPQGYCKFLDPAAGSVASTGNVVISGNVIRDSNSDGIMIIDDLGVQATATVTDNVIKDLSQHLPDPLAVGIIDHVVRSRGFTLIAIENTVSNLTIDDMIGSNLSPFGNFAADGIVFLTSGLNPVSNATVTDVEISNPLLSGDVSNGDSIEIQHRGSTNGILNIDIARARLSDPASTNIKIIESANPESGTYNVSVTDSVLTNINGAGTEDYQIRFSGNARTNAALGGTATTKAIRVFLRNVSISGLGGGIGNSGASNNNNVPTFQIMVENSSLSDLQREAIFYRHDPSKTIGTGPGGAVIDLGGGPLGSAGGNRIVDNGTVPASVPPDQAALVDAVVFTADVSVHNPNVAAANGTIQVFANQDYWGGGAPVVTTGPFNVASGSDIVTSGKVTVTATDFLTTDPNAP